MNPSPSVPENAREEGIMRPERKPAPILAIERRALVDEMPVQPGWRRDLFMLVAGALLGAALALLWVGAELRRMPSHAPWSWEKR